VKYVLAYGAVERTTLLGALCLLWEGYLRRRYVSKSAERVRLVPVRQVGEGKANRGKCAELDRCGFSGRLIFEKPGKVSAEVLRDGRNI
jgi:hypothetical protein